MESDTKPMVVKYGVQYGASGCDSLCVLLSQ